MAIVSRWGEGLLQPGSNPKKEEEKGLFSRIRNVFNKPPEPSPEELKTAEEQKQEHTRLLAMLNQIKRRFPSVYTVPYSTAVYEAQKRGMPISHVAPDSSAGIAYKTIAEEVMRWN
jgi:chromosome partitioning protein